MSLREIFVNKQKELEKIKADILKAKEKQQKVVDTAQLELGSIIKRTKQWNDKVVKYKLDKPSFIRLMYCIRESNTKRVVDKHMGTHWTTVNAPPEPIETLIEKYRVRELVNELSKLSDKTFTPPYTKDEITVATEKLTKERKKLDKL